MYLRFLSILEKKEKKLLYLLLIFSIIVFFLESLSFGILIPFIKYLFTGNSNFFEKIIQLLKINNYQFNIFLFSFIFLLFVVKNLLLYIYALLIYSFTFSLKENVSKKFYTLYLEADYISNLSTTISKKITLLSEVNNFINAINSVLNLLSEFFLIIIIALLLFYIDAYSTLILFFFCIITFILYLFFKKKIILNGNEKFKFSQLLSEIILDSFNLIKEITLFKKKTLFIDKFNNYNKEVYKIEKRQALLQFIPKLYFEIISILILLFVIFFIKLNINDTKVALTNVAIFTIAIVRLLPSINKIVFNMQNILNLKKSSNIIYNKLHNYQPTLNFKNIRDLKISKFKNIKLQNIYFAYSKKNYIIKKINLTIKKCDKICIFGPSGSGKTTLSNIILGLLKPTKGKIIYNNNENINYQNALNVNNIFGYVSQKVYLQNKTIRENILFGNKFDKQRFIRALNISGLREIINQKEFKNFINKKAGEKGNNLSGGQSQRVAISRALYHNAQILVFDEPTSYLDDVSCNKIISLIKKNNAHTFVIISHDKRFLQICNKIIYLK
jgi:ABC-type bacteriocin/lantibiotic exporter with double-glycine peptidase domain